MEAPRLRLAFGALRRFGVERSRLPPALERRLIALPEFGTRHRSGSNRWTGSGQVLAGPCPLWVRRRRWCTSKQCLLYPQKRTLEFSRAMSALCQKRTYAAQQKNAYSITSAVARIDCGMVRPSALAALRLSTVSYFVGACTGRSPGFSPLRIRST